MGKEKVKIRNYKRNKIILATSAVLIIVTSIFILGNINSSIDELNATEMLDVANHKYEIVTQELEILDKIYTYSPESDSIFLTNIHIDKKSKKNLYNLNESNSFKNAISVDLNTLNNYLANRKYGHRSYFKLFDKSGICLISPEKKDIGKYYDRYKFNEIDKKIIKSDFLGIDVFVKNYPSNIIFKDATIIVSVPILTFKEDVQKLSNHSLLLGLGDMFIVSVLFYLFILEQRKIERLQLQHLGKENEHNKIKYLHLREQFNPHFLFNSLGSLTHLIGKDIELSKKFIVKMTKFYRKIIQTNAKELATVHEEIELAKDYIFLQKVRFGDSISEIQYHLPDHVLTLKLPRFSIQMLFENAINSSQFSSKEPLKITIDFDHENMTLKIVYTFVAKSSTYLDNTDKSFILLKSIYQYYNTDKFDYQIIEDNFSVTLPLIEE